MSQFDYPPDGRGGGAGWQASQRPDPVPPDWELAPDTWYRDAAPRPARARRRDTPAKAKPPGHRAQPPRAPARPRRDRSARRRHPWGTIVVLAVVLSLAVYGLARFGYGRKIGLALPEPTGPVQIFAVSAQPGHYIGIATRGPGFQNRVPSFAHNVLGGHEPGIVEFYRPWLAPFPSGVAWYLARQKILPLIQINPYHVSLAKIAAGDYDAYLRTYADQVRSFRAPVAISFGHEMNGWWYPWGLLRTKSGGMGGTRPATFIAAWRHIHGVFSKEHAYNVKWVWTVRKNVNRKGWAPAQAWWPGRQYVNWIGIDGYFRTTGDTFSSVIGSQVKYLRTFSNKPMLITETGVNGRNRDFARQIGQLFAGVRNHPRLLGFIWFDLDSRKTHIHWNIDHSRAAIAAFRKGLRRYAAAPTAAPHPGSTGSTAPGGG